MRLQRIKQLVCVLQIIKGIIFPIFKLCLIAMSEKLLREVVETALESTPGLFEQLEDEVFDRVDENKITRVYLMQGLDFYETFAVSLGLVLALSLVFPLSKTLQQNYLNHMEVKRLQAILYEKFILEPNSVAIAEASDLLYTKIASINKYWIRTKYSIIDNVSTMATGLIIFLVLAWDLGLIYLGASGCIFFVTALVWNKLSTPFAEQKESKTAETNDLLIDLVVCKELVLTHARESDEQTRLKNAIEADRSDIQHLVRAGGISDFIRTSTFTMCTPVLFLFVFQVDPSLDRLFQLLIILVITDELMRSYFDFMDHGPTQEEYQRAQHDFCHVLGIEDKDELFPPDFNFASWFKVCRPVPPSDGRKEKQQDGKEELQEETMRSMTEGHDSPASPGLGTGNDHGREAPLLSSVESALRNPSESDLLSFKNVSFGYPTKEGNGMFHVVDNLNISFALGHHYAIMGETGIGKSTILKSLAGLLQPLTGTISVSGKAVDTSSPSWRKQVAVVSQDSVLLNRTLRENLCYGGGDKTDAEILGALDKVNMRSRVMMLPNGLDTVIRENGQEFSGGQRQRLQIARLLLSSCPLVLLDEFTSALDSATTETVLRVMERYLVGKTLIMISHDVQTLALVSSVLSMTSRGVEFKDRPSYRRNSGESIRDSLRRSGELVLEDATQMQRDSLRRISVASSGTRLSGVGLMLNSFEHEFEESSVSSMEPTPGDPHPPGDDEESYVSEEEEEGVVVV